MLRELAWKVFPPYESTVTKRVLRGFLEQHNGLANDEIERILFSYLKREPQVIVDAIRINHKPAEQVAMALVTGILRTRLTSGNYHTYHGMLNMIGEDMYRVWCKAVGIMSDKGYLDAEAANQLRSEVHSEIKSVG